MSGSLLAWLEDRQPAVPPAFAPWMRPSRTGAPAGWRALVREAEGALSRAARGDRRRHGGAFDLLVADGFVTWACEAALEEADPLPALDAILSDVAG